MSCHLRGCTVMSCHLTCCMRMSCHLICCMGMTVWPRGVPTAAGGSKRPGRSMFDLGVKLNPGGQVNDSWTVWPRRVMWESGHLGRANWLSCVTACYPSADLEAAGAWSQLSNLKDPEMQQLAKEVPDHCSTERQTVLLRSTLARSRDGSCGRRQSRRYMYQVSLRRRLTSFSTCNI